MDLKLRGKRALVTGSTAGIGFAIARGLARERAEVIVNGRSEAKVFDAVQRINSEIGSRASGIVADLSSADGVEQLVEACGRIDVLVNNVGIFEPRPFLKITDEDWFRYFETNVMSTCASRGRCSAKWWSATGDASFSSPASRACRSRLR